MGYKPVYNNYSGVQFRVDGTLRTADSMYVKIDGYIKNAESDHTKIDGYIKQISCYSYCSCDTKYFCNCDDDDCDCGHCAGDGCDCYGGTCLGYQPCGNSYADRPGPCNDDECSAHGCPTDCGNYKCALGDGNC